MAEVTGYLSATDNKSSNFYFQKTLVSDGSCDVLCNVTLEPCINTNLNSVFVKLNDNPNTVIATKSSQTSFSINIPKSWFNNNNNVATIQVDTYDKNNVYIPGTFRHSIPIYNRTGRYENRVSDFDYPSGVLPGSTCIINILPPKDCNGKELSTSNLIYEVSINCFAALADNRVVISETYAGRCSFVIPNEATASCIEIKVTTIDAKTGDRLGSVVHSVPLGQAQSDPKQTLSKPQLLFPDGYELNITEGVNVKIKGTSQNINDYMIIYATKDCNVAEAVSKYETSSGYYAAPKAELKQRLLDNAKGDLNYFVLKQFDSYNSTFISPDDSDASTFNIRTPRTNDYETLEDFYALQWFKAHPGQLIYLHVIERKWVEEKRTETIVTSDSNYITRGQVNVTKWKCHHCDLADYRTWSVSAPWNPYGQLNLSTIKSYLNQYAGHNIQLIFSVTLDRQVKFPPDITFNSSKARNTKNCATPITNGPAKTFEYSVPLSYVQQLINEGRTTMFMHTHYGRNKNYHESATYKKGSLTIKAAEIIKNEVISGGISYYIYSDNEAYIKDVTKIPESSMTPYIVLPPAVRPLSLKVKEKTTKQVTISYKNPLYEQGTQIIFPTYTKLGEVIFDVSQGDDANFLSDLNPIIDNEVEKQIDYTLHLNENEKRFTTYEKKLSIPQSLLSSISNTTSNNIYLDLNISSVDNKPINFKNILSSDIKMQIMFSKSGSNKTRAIDISSTLMELKNKSYSIQKMTLERSLIMNNAFDTIHLLYNSDEYDKGKVFATRNWTMMIDSNRVSNGIGWRKIGTSFGTCSFKSDTFEIAKYALNYDKHKIRLVLENLSANSKLYRAPNIKVKYYKSDKPVELMPTNTGEIQVGEDIIYEIPSYLYDVAHDDVLEFTMSPSTPYPQNLSDITFSNAYIEVLGMESLDQIPDKYARGFMATITMFDEKKKSNQDASAAMLGTDPVEGVDIIMCCFDRNKNLINKTNTKRRDIFYGREFVYYSDRKWHSFVSNKYAYSAKFKEEYDMTFSIPDNTDHMFFVAFTYGNWAGNPSIYSMSNILAEGSIQQDMALQFINPSPTYDSTTNTFFANCDVNNPKIELRLNSEQSNCIQITPAVSDSSSFNLAEDPFDIEKWETNPIIYSYNKTYGYEQPIFEVKDLYVQNNVISSNAPLYNSIEYYSQWKELYGKDVVDFEEKDINADSVDINSDYTIFEDEGDKFISNKAVPYIELPAELINYDRSKITLFLDSDFGVGNVIIQEKFVTETYTENYTITKYRGNKWGVKTLWTSKMMKAFEDVASIEDIKIEWGMKLNRNHTHPTEGRRGPILVEDLWVNANQSYDYDPAVKFPDECKGDKIKDYGGHDIWHKNYGDYIYFEITNPRIKRLFLECNCHRRRHDAIMFEDYQYDWCWDTTVKVKFTVTRKVKGDGSPLYKKQPLGSEHYGSTAWVPGWDMYQMPKFKYSNIELIKAPTASDPTFIAKYDVRLSPVVFYYKNNPVTGDALGNIYKYTWGDNPDAYMKWETITVQGKAPYTHTRTHYYIAYELPNTVYDTFIFDIDKDGVITPR